MLLVAITVNPKYCIKALAQDRESPNVLKPHVARLTIRHGFAGALPELLVKNAQRLWLDPDTPAHSVQVMLHEFGVWDVNIPNIRVQVQFSEQPPALEDRQSVRNWLYRILIEWFHEQGLEPENLVVDLFWGPTNGMGTVNGVEIEW